MEEIKQQTEPERLLRQKERKNMKYIVLADNGQTLIMNLDKEEAVVFAMEMKERYPENNFYVRKQVKR